MCFEMGHTLKNFLAVLLVLILTIVTVSVLSLATEAKAEPAAEYVKAVQAQVHKEEVTVLSAAAPEVAVTNWGESACAFLALLSIPTVGMLIYLGAKRKGRLPKAAAARRYSPRSDMAFRPTR